MHTDAEPIENALAKLSALHAVIGRTMDEPSHVRRPCLLAQVVQRVFPEAVDCDDPSELSLRYAELVPLLVARPSMSLRHSRSWWTGALGVS